jgi:hypothetical protein
MRITLRQGIGIALLIAIGCAARAPIPRQQAPVKQPVSPLILNTQGGPIGAIPDDVFAQDQSVWIGFAQNVANDLGEAIAVTQDRNLIVLLNPEPIQDPGIF